MLQESKKRQKSGLRTNKTIDCTGKTKYSSAASRQLVIPLPVHKSQLASSRVDEMDRSEVYRILGTWQKRVKVAEWLKDHKWVDDYDSCKNELGFVDRQVFVNILRSKKVPAAPKIKNARIPLAKSDSQFCKLEWFGNKIFLKDFRLWNEKVALKFVIPEKVLENHKNFTKITRPVIRLDKDEKVVFDFTLVEEVEQEQVYANSMLAFDLGLAKPFSGARVYNDGRYSEEFTPSVESMRHYKTVQKLDSQLKLVARKNQRRRVLGFSKGTAIDQERQLRDKKKRANKSLDWSVARDMIAHSKPGETIILEKLNWASGGLVKFRHSLVQQKVEHIASREGKNIVKVDPKYSSQTCPQCDARVKPNTKRALVCECGWNDDRDYTAAVELGRRGHKSKPTLSRRKDSPTPKSPRQRRKKKFIFRKKNTSWTRFTGLTPGVATSAASPAATASDVITSTSIAYPRE